MTKMAADIGMPEFFSVGSLVTCRTCSDKVCSASSYYLPRLPSYLLKKIVHRTRTRKDQKCYSCHYYLIY
jgi:hypothetical protein